MNLLSSLMMPVFAAEGNVSINPPDAFNKLNSVTLPNIVSMLITFVLVVAAIIFFFILVIGGIKWILSQGEEQKVKAARDQVTHALIGLVIVFAAWAIIKLIGYLFSVDLLNLTLTKVVS